MLSIGVNLDSRNGFSFLSYAYTSAIAQAGGIPLLIPPMDVLPLKEVLGKLDGFVLTSGNDLDCRNDGHFLHPSMKLLEPEREKFDRKLVKLISARHLPVLGIGTGMHLLNVAMGGTLYLHLPDDKPRAMPHADSTDPDHAHPLSVTEGSWLSSVYPTNRKQEFEQVVRVNSMHHQSVDDVADGFTVSARCPDGIVEAIESTDPNWFAVGVQFHPQTGSRMDMCVFDMFLRTILTRQRDWGSIATRQEDECKCKTDGTTTYRTKRTKNGTPCATTTGLLPLAQPVAT